MARFTIIVSPKGGRGELARFTIESTSHAAAKRLAKAQRPEFADCDMSAMRGRRHTMAAASITTHGVTQ